MKKFYLQKNKKLKILHLSYSDILGGAAISAYRLNCALRKYTRLDSNMLVVKKYSDNKNVHSFESDFNLKLYYFINKIFFHLLKFQKKKNKISQSINLTSIINLKSKIAKFDPDIIHLHWINNSMISIKNIGTLNYKKVWTFTDMWPMSGTEHYPDYNRYIKGYNSLNKPDENYGIDLDKFIWEKKKKYFKNSFKIISISDWLKKKINQSFLFRKNKVNVIPCTVDTKVWKPKSKAKCKKKLNLHKYENLLLFSCSTGTIDKRKGFDTILKIFNKKKYINNKYLVVIIGRVDENSLKKIKFNFKIYDDFYMGDVNFLRDIYCSCDLLLMPSVFEAFGQTSIEAGSCNVPTVGFNRTGLETAIIHKKTGYLSRHNSIDDFEKGIGWSLNNIKKLKKTTRKYINKIFSYKVIAKEYEKIYLNLNDEGN